jgi:hypothetical protein
VPGIVLNTGLRHNPRLRLHRTVIEIRDTTLVLSSYADIDLKQQARDIARAADLPNEEGDAMADALWLRAALSRKTAGHQPAVLPVHHATEPPPEPAHFGTETERLMRISAFHHSPTADDFTRTPHMEHP